MILAPAFYPRKDEDNAMENSSPDGNDSRALAGFRAVYVFDESMTAGNPLPQIGSINGDPREYRERLAEFVAEQSTALEYSDDIAPARDTSTGGKITLLSRQSPAEEFATLAHELAHLCGDEIYVAH